MVLTCGVVAVSAGCAVEAGEPVEDIATNELSWEEFRANVYQEPDTGVFIVNGDEPIETEEGLRGFFEELQDGALIVHRSGGQDVKWSAAQQNNITYCVSTTFGNLYQTTVDAMNAATGAWEAAANVNFVHLSQYDSNCTGNQSNVLFDVRPVKTTQYLARAFFPNSSRKNRNVLIDDSAYGKNPDVTGVLRHELGHALGFRHEHTRPESGVCFEDTSWRALTPYDSSSVMHYPQCNGTNTWALNLTSQDKAGAAALYGN
ncbi:MAG: matrixin family metalloprotease [Polyangiaceae bacterium]|nr:matrixin family metalloprotease [Polyangiaceae bacterium]